MSQTISTLAVDVVANTSGLTDGLELTKKELREVGRLADSSSSPFKASADRINLLGRAFEQNKIGGVEYAQAVAKQRMEMLSSVPVFGQFAGLLNPITAATTVATAGLAAMSAGVAGLGAVVASRIEDIDRLGDSAARLGVSTSSLSRLEVAATLGDVDPATVESAMTKMLTAVGKGDDAFAKIGLDVEKLKGLQADQLFGAIANEIEKMPTLSDRMGFLGDIGIRDKEVLGLLSRFDELSAAAERSGAVVGDELASRVAATDDSMKQLKATLTGLANDLTYVAAPAVKTVVDALTELLGNPEQTKAAMGNLGLVFGGISGGRAGQQLADMMAINRDLMRQEQFNRQAIAPDRTKDIALEDARTQKEIDKEVADHKKELARMIRDDEARADADARMARMAAAKELADRERELRAERTAAWDKKMKEVEDGQKLIDSLKAPAEATKDRLLSDLDALRKSGLDSPETRDRLFRRAAGELARQEQGGFGAPGADKGTRAAREAIIGAQHQAEQVDLLRRIEDRLRALVEKDELEVTEITAS